MREGKKEAQSIIYTRGIAGAHDWRSVSLPLLPRCLSRIVVIGSSYVDRRKQIVFSTSAAIDHQLWRSYLPHQAQPRLNRNSDVRHRWSQKSTMEAKQSKTYSKHKT